VQAQKKPETLSHALRDALSQSDIVISETMMLSEVEQSRKDQNAIFVKDAGQTGRALIKIQQESRETDDYAELSEKSAKISRLL
jgi:precorrin-6B methylase 1